jgi:hypothetical protein
MVPRRALGLPGVDADTTQSRHRLAGLAARTIAALEATRDVRRKLPIGGIGRHLRLLGFVMKINLIKLIG